MGEADAPADAPSDEPTSNGARGAGDPAADASARAGCPTPYYHDDLVDIYNADATHLDFLADRSVQLVVTSPPYNLGKDYGTARDNATYVRYLEWVASWSRELYRVLEPGGRLCLNIPLDINLSFDEGGKRTTSKQPVLADFTERLVRDLGFVYNTTILWLEGNISRRTAWGSWLSAADPWVNTAAEVVLVLSRDHRKRSGKGKTPDVGRDDFMDWTLGLWKFKEGKTPDVSRDDFMKWTLDPWEFNGQSTGQHGHPSPFPEELPRRLIQLFSFREDVVLDPFLGSGTTCCVAKKLGRRSIGVEINPKFCKIAADRCRRSVTVTASVLTKG